jgi:hypothetical protein
MESAVPHRRERGLPGPVATYKILNEPFRAQVAGEAATMDD